MQVLPYFISLEVTLKWPNRLGNIFFDTLGLLLNLHICFIIVSSLRAGSLTFVGLGSTIIPTCWTVLLATIGIRSLLKIIVSIAGNIHAFPARFNTNHNR